MTSVARRAPRFIIIGAGMAGIASAVKLRAVGLDDFVIYEKADRLGGTWRDNTYPGVACDVPSHLYSYSFAPNPDWTHVFSPGPEICAYLEAVATEHDLHGRIVLGAEVTRLERHGRLWHLFTAEGREDRAEVVIAATGVLHHPAYPDIEGMEDFAGPVFHSARWDHSVELRGARLGVIGTGSSAVQITGAVVDEVTELVLFQRTAQWILPVANPPVSEEDRLRFRAHPETMRVLKENLAQTFTANFADAVIDAESAGARQLEEVCRAHLMDSVADPDLRERLRPDYRAACKRLVVSPDFYAAIQKPNARLVTDPILRVEPGGVRTADGVLHGLDVLVLATGFQVDRFLRPIQVLGRHGVELDQVWAERPSAYLSVSVPGFPNLFLLNGPNGPVGNFSLIDVAECQLDYIIQLLGAVLAGAAAEVGARPEAAERFEAERVAAASRTIWVTGCRSWYLDDRGVPAAWPWTMERFRQAMARPNMDDFELVGGPTPGPAGPPRNGITHRAQDRTQGGK
ncbi:MAG: flavin-containing monooxygenase [Acidimicrobiales bacterium]